MQLPEIIGIKLTGKLAKNIVATDIALYCVNFLRSINVVGKIVEFIGEGLKELSTTDRATISNMLFFLLRNLLINRAPEYGATMVRFSFN